MATSLGARAVTAVSGAARSLGKALDSMGASMEVAKYTERLVPSTRIVAVDGSVGQGGELLHAHEARGLRRPLTAEGDEGRVGE